MGICLGTRALKQGSEGLGLRGFKSPGPGTPETLVL